MRVHRRRFATMIAVVSLVTLAGCSFFKNLTGNSVVQNIQKIAAGLSTLAQVASGFVSSDVLTKVQAALAEVESLAAQVVAGTAPTAAILTAIESGISALAGLLGPIFPQAPPIAAAIGAAISVIESLLQAAGIVPTPGPAAAKLRATKAMTTDEALALLDRYAVTGIR